MTSPGDGPIENATARLRAWLERVSGRPVRVGPPRDDNDDSGGGGDHGERPGLTLWPWELRPQRQTQGTGTRPPYRFAVRFLVAAGTGPDGLGLLDRVLGEAVRAGEPELSLEAPDGTLWSSLRATPRPVLVFDVPASVSHARPETPLVRGPLVVQPRDIRPLAGSVLGPGDQPAAGVRVEVAGTGLAAYTDRLGRFVLGGVPAGDRIGLRLSGRGRTFAADVDLTGDGPVVVHCDFASNADTVGDN